MSNKKKKGGKRKKPPIKEKGIKGDIILPDQFEIMETIRKEPVPTTQQHKPKKGKGSYRRKPKHTKKEE